MRMQETCNCIFSSLSTARQTTLIEIYLFIFIEVKKSFRFAVRLIRVEHTNMYKSTVFEND